MSGDDQRPRILIVASTGYGYIAPVVRDAHALLDQAGTVLITRTYRVMVNHHTIVDGQSVVEAREEIRDRSGAERAVALWWRSRHAGQVDQVDDPAAWVADHAAQLLGAVVAIHDRDPEPLATYWALLDAGIPVVRHNAGRSAARPGSDDTDDQLVIPDPASTEHRRAVRASYSHLAGRKTVERRPVAGRL